MAIFLILKRERMSNYRKKIIQAVDYIQNHTEAVPLMGLITGTGLGESAKLLDNALSLEYSEIPGFPVPTVQSHHGRIISGQVAGKQVIAMQGRFHLYEGFSPSEVTFPVRVLQELGVRHIILSNAAGGLKRELSEGDIMAIYDHINLTGSNPLEGPNEDEWGVRFPDMSCVYDDKMAALAMDTGTELGLSMKKGVYAGLRGPSLETPAESKYLKMIGADAVGFSTVHEAITAIHAGMKVLGLSIITNVHTPEKPISAKTEDIIALAEKITPKLEKLIKKVIEKL